MNDSTVKITWSDNTHTSITAGRKRNTLFRGERLAHDIQGTLYSCSGLTSHTVREELSASSRGARGP